MEHIPATNRNGCWCLVHVEWIFFESSTCGSSDNQDLAILWPRDLRHLPHPGEGSLHFLLPPSPGFRVAQVWILLKYIQISCTLQSLVVQFCLSTTGRTALAWYTGSRHQQAVARKRHSAWGVTCSTYLLCVPLVGDYSRLWNPSASSSFIVLSNHLTEHSLHARHCSKHISVWILHSQQQPSP